MKMDKNSQNSCTGNSWHINIRSFFVKDSVDKKKIEIVHCPSEVMLADYFTKTVQGRLFKTFREVIMGWKHISTLKQISVPLKDCVGECIDGRFFSKKTYLEAITTGFS